MALPEGAATADTLANDDLGSIFGIDLDAGEGVPAPSARKPPASAGATSSGFRPTGTLVARLREQCGFSVAEFAALLRVSAASVRRWEAAPGPLDLQSRPREALLALRLEIEKHDD
jgi:hypothetical protein